MTLYAKDIMSKKLITVSAETTLNETMDLMSEKRIRHMPVVDENLTVIGIVSQRDLSMSFPAIMNATGAPIKHFMTTPVKYMDESTPVRSLIFKMLENKISCVIVGNDQENAVGIITTDDLLWYFAELLKNDSEKHRSFFDITSLQTIGEVANKLSNIGI